MKNFPSIHIFLALLMVCAFCYAPLSAQTLDSTKADSVQKPRENWYWVSTNYYPLPLGLGISTIDKSYGLFAIGLALSYAYNNTLWSLNGFGVFRLFVGRDTYTIGPMYGWIDRGDWGFSSVSVGIAYNESSENSGRGFTIGYRTRTGGVALTAEAQVALKAYVPGIGLKINGGLGTNDSFLVATLMFHLGWMP